MCSNLATHASFKVLENKAQIKVIKVNLAI